MRVLLSIVVLSLWAINVYAEEVTVLAASGTSQSKSSDDVTCLLDDNCTGIWQPGSQDEGVDEGLYFQFETPVLLHSIKLYAEKEPEARSTNLQIYLNGKTTSPDDIVYRVSKKVNANKKNVTYTFKGGDQVNFKGSLNTEVKSVFIKINKAYYSKLRIKPTFKALHFYKLIDLKSKKEVKAERVKFKLPVIVGAKVKASSVLSPFTAYQPANLFDSKYDFAWSTDGNNTNGINETLSLSFTRKLNLSGLYIWNGYQRSATHSKKNGKVKTLIVKDNNGNQFEIPLKNKSGLQKIKFNKTLNEVASLKLKIKDIYRGTKYKDVLISELRLIDDKGQIILPFIKKKTQEVKEQHKTFIGHSWSSFLGDITDGMDCDTGCYYKRIRLRKNGTFVIYKDIKFENGGGQSANVLEGNWAYHKNKIRIFGKKYSTSLTSSDYMKGQKNNTVPSAKIFQSYLTIKRYLDLSKKEKKKLISYYMKNRVRISSYYAQNKDKPGEKLKLTWTHYYKKIKYNEAQGASAEKVKDEMKKVLIKINPYYIKSSVMTDLFLPTEDVSQCSESC